jgi:hypothetical protein
MSVSTIAHASSHPYSSRDGNDIAPWDISLSSDSIEVDKSWGHERVIAKNSFACAEVAKGAQQHNHQHHFQEQFCSEHQEDEQKLQIHSSQPLPPTPPTSSSQRDHENPLLQQNKQSRKRKQQEKLSRQDGLTPVPTTPVVRAEYSFTNSFFSPFFFFELYTFFSFQLIEFNCIAQKVEIKPRITRQSVNQQLQPHPQHHAPQNTPVSSSPPIIAPPIALQHDFDDDDSDNDDQNEYLVHFLGAKKRLYFESALSSCSSPSSSSESETETDLDVQPKKREIDNEATDDGEQAIDRLHQKHKLHMLQQQELEQQQQQQQQQQPQPQQEKGLEQEREQTQQQTEQRKLTTRRRANRWTFTNRRRRWSSQSQSRPKSRTAPKPRNKCQCDFPGCGRVFSRPSSVTKHYRTHNPSKPYSCSECGKSFAVKSYLVLHMRVHNDDRPYVCDFEGCDKSFTRPFCLRRHQVSHE